MFTAAGLPSPASFPAGYYYYGANQHGPGHYPRWIDALYREDEQVHGVQRYSLRSQDKKDLTALVQLS